MDSNPTTRAGPRDVLRRGHGGASVVGPVPGRRMARIDARADHVGSLLRPPSRWEAWGALAGGRREGVGCKGVEDAALREVVALQEGAGCRVVADGEVRRGSFLAELVAATTGV